ncbi:hypothetical protein P4O66_021247 [Electrophorus voltai]|uniref:Uncharacterized protein n=1 Tax=Electrophorus voltai TaxID=2609070 RepID=A0AAD8ZNQ0_9TELE|nr:hypothetical protein P4O66_021247 [Electrophorus voltai]
MLRSLLSGMLWTRAYAGGLLKNPGGLCIMMKVGNYWSKGRGCWLT